MAQHIISIIILNAKLILLDDFKIQINDLNDPKASTLWNFLDCFNLPNCIFPILISKSTLGLVITDINSTLAINFMQSKLISDHFAVSFTISILPVMLNTYSVTNRKFNQIDQQISVRELQLILDSRNITIDATLEYMVEFYKSTPLDVQTYMHQSKLDILFAAKRTTLVHW